MSLFPPVTFEEVSLAAANGCLVLHNGNTYRFDGWARSEVISSSGTDQRSGRKGRRKWIWVWTAS